MAAGATRAIVQLERAGVDHLVLEYDTASLDESQSLGGQVASILGVAAASVFKTLVAEAGDAHVIAVVPVDTSLDLKALASAAGAKRAAMADPQEAERLTGYVTGAISPFGLRRRLSVFIDTSVDDHETIHLSAGKRGLELALVPSDLIRLTDAKTCSLRH